VRSHFMGCQFDESFDRIHSPLAASTANWQSDEVRARFLSLIMLGVASASALAESYISQYQGNRIYAWDGEYLSKY
jgi:hypothetical protein